MSDINLTDSTTVLATLTEVIEEIAGPRSVAITREAAFDADLGLDSLTMVESSSSLKNASTSRFRTPRLPK